jgi:hypothetical protein
LRLDLKVYDMKSTLHFALSFLFATSTLYARTTASPAKVEPVMEWVFTNSNAGWGEPYQCKLTADVKGLIVSSTESDPHLLSPKFDQAGPVWAQVRLKSKYTTMCQLFWMTSSYQAPAEARSASFKASNDGQWHDYVVPIPESGSLTLLRFDPGEDHVDVQLGWIRLYSAPPDSAEAAAPATEAVTSPAEAVDASAVARSKWTFHESLAGWRQPVQCDPRPEKDVLKLHSVGADPSMASPPFEMTGPVTVRLRMKTNLPGRGQIFWLTRQSPKLSEAMSAGFDLIRDDQWHDYEVKLPAQGVVVGLRFDPGEGPGEAQIEWIEAQGAAALPDKK